MVVRQWHAGWRIYGGGDVQALRVWGRKFRLVLLGIVFEGGRAFLVLVGWIRVEQMGERSALY